MKTIAFSLVPTLLCVALVGFGFGSTTVLYLRNPTLDKVKVHIERIGGSFAYKTTEILAYSPIVYNHLSLATNFQHPFSVSLIGVDVANELQFAVKPEVDPEVPAASTNEPINDSIIDVDDDDTVAIEAATK